MNSRRHVLKAGLCGLAGAALPLRAFAQNALQVTRLGGNAALIAGAGGNVLAVSDGRSVTLADSGAADRTDALMDALAAEFPGQPVATLFNTHWHPAQTGGNAAFARAGANVVAHANTRLWMTTPVAWPWGGSVPAAPQDAWPMEIFYNEPVEHGAARAGYMLQAHTDGDAWVHFPDANIIHVGGVIAADRWPLIDWWTGGWFGGLVEATETLLQISDADTRFVAADGPVFGRAELQAQSEMYADLFLYFRDNLLFKGLSPEEAAAERPTKDYRPLWGDPDPFVIRAFQSLWGYYAPDA